MEPQIYKLNLPPLEDCILDGVDEKYFNIKNAQDYIKVDPILLFKEEYLKLNNLKWDKTLIFFKSSKKPGVPHTDAVDFKLTTWAINWIYKGFGIMDYWKLCDFESKYIKFVIDKQGYETFNCKATKPPRIRYFLRPGAYLVNTTNVHSATGLGPRFCVSYRTSIIETNWKDIVEIFKEQIVEEKISLF
jgi:hypothetical protein